MAKSFITSILIFLSLALIETAILSNMTFLPAVPDLILIAAIYVSIVNGKTYGVILGFFSGLILDYVSGCPFGFNSLLRTILGYLAGFLFETINYKGVIMPLLIGLAATVAKIFLTWIISLFFPNFVINYSVFSFSFISELLLNIILCPVIFKLIGCFDKSIVIRSGDYN